MVQIRQIPRHVSRKKAPTSLEVTNHDRATVMFVPTAAGLPNVSGTLTIWVTAKRKCGCENWPPNMSPKQTILKATSLAARPPSAKAVL